MQGFRVAAIAAAIAGVFILPHFDAASSGWRMQRAEYLVIKDDLGGYVDEYEDRYTKLIKQYDNVRIDGECSSSCTILFAYFPLEKICVTDRAWLGFHSPTEEDKEGNWVPTEEGAREMMEVYPAHIRAWIEKNGGLKEDMIFLAGQELQQYLKPCGVIKASSLSSNAAN